MNLSKYEGKTFPAGKTAEELGIDTSRKFVLTRDIQKYHPRKNSVKYSGGLVFTVKDANPKQDYATFLCSSGYYGKIFCISWYDLAYLEEEDGKIEYTVDPEKDVDTTDFLSGMNYIPRVGDKVRLEGKICKIHAFNLCTVEVQEKYELTLKTSSLTLISRAPRTLTKAEAEKMLSEKLGEDITIE